MNHLLYYTQPAIGGSSNTRYYVYFSHVVSNKKHRIYSGVDFGMRSARGLSASELQLYFKTLLATVTLKLSTGWHPEEQQVKPVVVAKALWSYEASIHGYIDKAQYGDKHKYTLKWYWKELCMAFGDSKLDAFKKSELQTYLMNRYVGSNTSYNTAKRYYKCIFNLLIELGHCADNPVVGIKNKKAEASINQAFENKELKKLLEWLKANDIVLYRVAILMYTTFMRPHQEVRLLKVKYFDLDEGQLVLPPRYTKNGKQVTIPLQLSVLEEFDYLRQMEGDAFVFGAVNPCYFATRWGKKLKKNYQLKPNQTLYSIRHTAAVEMYKRTKDVALIQRLMNHSSMEVTIGYLRSLNCSLAGNQADMYPRL